MQLRDYQQFAADLAGWLLAHAEPNAPPKQLFAAPTGCGKSFAALGVANELTRLGYRVCITAPSIEILEGFASKMGVELPAAKSQIPTALTQHELWTPRRLINRLMKGEVRPYDAIIVDEAHHSTSKTEQIVQAVHGLVPMFGFTATAFRGSPRETEKLVELWGPAEQLITWQIAAKRGYVSIPDFKIVPLINDDQITLSGGEFKVAAASKFIGTRLDSLVEFIAGVWHSDPRASMLSLPSGELVMLAAEKLERVGVPCAPVTQTTTRKARHAAFEACVAHEALLIQINVVSEGVDLPLRIAFNASPTMSPVRFLQRVGRFTRPVPAGEPPPLVYCFDRDLERHGYLLNGMIPWNTFKELQDAFEEPSMRSGHRQIGLEILGRFKPLKLATTAGLDVTVYNLTQMVQNDLWQYVVVLMPGCDRKLVAKRTSTKLEAGAYIDGKVIMAKWRYGPWQRCELPLSFDGFQTSASRKPASPKQASSWNQQAKRVGLEPDIEVTSREVSVMYALLGTGQKITF